MREGLYFLVFLPMWGCGVIFGKEEVMVELKHQASLAQEQILDLTKRFGVDRGVSDKKQVEKSLDAGEEKKLKEELVDLAQKLNQEMHRLNIRVGFNYNETIEGLLVTVKDADGDKVIREIPSKEAIELMKKMRDLIGVIFDKQG